MEFKFTDKHARYITKTTECKFNVAEGSIRAGKTIDNCISFAYELLKTPDKIHLATGSTIANAKLNIGECNGYGLYYLLNDSKYNVKAKWGKYLDNDCLYITHNNDEKVVIFAGGGQADSYKKILGNSYGLWIATEINEHYDSDDSRTSFIKVAMGRQVASANPKIYWDLNPSNPNFSLFSKPKYKLFIALIFFLQHNQ